MLIFAQKGGNMKQSRMKENVNAVLCALLECAVVILVFMFARAWFFKTDEVLGIVLESYQIEDDFTLQLGRAIMFLLGIAGSLIAGLVVVLFETSQGQAVFEPQAYERAQKYQSQMGEFFCLMLVLLFFVTLVGSIWAVCVICLVGCAQKGTMTAQDAIFYCNELALASGLFFVLVTVGLGGSVSVTRHDELRRREAAARKVTETAQAEPEAESQVETDEDYFGI